MRQRVVLERRADPTPGSASARKPVNEPWARCGVDGAVAAERQARHLVAAGRANRARPAPSAPSSGSPTNMPSTSGARSIDSAGVVEACGPKQNIGAPKCALQRRHLGDVGVERRRRARKDDERRPEALGVEPRDDLVDRQAFRCRVRSDAHAAAARRAGAPRHERERVGRLGRAEHVLALLASALTRERDAADERRVDEQRVARRGYLPSSLHDSQGDGAPRSGAFRKRLRPRGSGDSSTLQQRRQTGKIPFSTRRRRSSTYVGPFQISSSD